MWTVVVSLLGTYVSLIGQSSTSALLNPVALWQPPVRCVRGCNREPSLTLTRPFSPVFTLTILMSYFEAFSLPSHSGRDSQGAA